LNKSQLISIAGFLGLFFILYFGCSTTPKKYKLIEKSRAAQQESTSAIVLIREAKNSLEKDKQDLIQVLEHELEISSEEEKTAVLKKISATWYSYGFGIIAGYFAEQIAEIEQTAESWGIAGTSYTLGIGQSKDEKHRSYALQRGVKTLENAISIDPKNVEYQLNKAILLAQNPPAENPMKGIQELLQLNSSFPDNVSILVQLARFGMQTGQYDKAVNRLERALSLDPKNKKASCLLADAYKQLGQIEQAELFSAKCDTINL
jgi:tetratricopeptide (TPR) repeat protein